MPPYPMYPESRHGRHWFSYAGLYLLLALVLGGGTRGGLMSDAILFLLGLPLAWHFFKTFPGRESRLVSGFILAAFALFLWQLFPWYGAQGLRFPNTVDAWRTLQAFIMFLITVSLFWRLAGESDDGRWLAARWMFVGVALNLLFSLLVYAGNNRVFEPFGWRMHAGFFANENHLALLYVICTPLIVAWFGKSRWPWLSLPVILGLVAVNFVVGSRAGVSLIILAAVLSYVYVLANRRMMLIVLLAAAALGGWWLFARLGWSEDITPGESGVNRMAFWLNTWKAIRDYWPWGSGFGTFVPVYAGYEQLEEIGRKYVNRAHNDWLELMLEGGLMAMVLAGVLVLALLKRFFLNNSAAEQRASFLAVLFILIHSVVDYPLRTMAIAACAALLMAWIFRLDQSRRRHVPLKHAHGMIEQPLQAGAYGK